MTFHNLTDLSLKDLLKVVDNVDKSIYHNKKHEIRCLAVMPYNIHNANSEKDCCLISFITTNGLYPTRWITLPNNHPFCNCRTNEHLSSNLMCNEINYRLKVNTISWIPEEVKDSLNPNDELIGWNLNSLTDFVVNRLSKAYPHNTMIVDHKLNQLLHKCNINRNTIIHFMTELFWNEYIPATKSREQEHKIEGVPLF